MKFAGFSMVNAVLLLCAVLVTGCGDGSTVDYRQDDGTGISATSPESGQVLANTAGWEQKAVFYHVWMRAFCDGEYGDGIGDLKGVISKLDYLGDLGVNAIWLSPVFECSFKNANMHGYDTTDYYRINDRFGTSEDVRNLLVAAHAKGIRVIFDFVPNHTSSEHPWVDSHAEYYKRATSDQNWPLAWNSNVTSGSRWYRNGSWYFYSAFNTSTLFDLDFMYTADGGATYPARTAMKDVMKYWLDRGFDGIRIDAARYLVEDGAGLQADRPNTHVVLKDFRALLDKYSSASAKMMVGEVWTSTSVIRDYYSGGTDEFNMCFDFGLPYNISAAVGQGTASAYTGYYTDTVKSLSFPNHLATFTVNHDNVVSRAATLYSGSRVKCIDSAALNLFSYGVPFVYYGEEVGMTGASGEDINLRADFPWARVDTMNADSQSLLSWYKYLIAARTGNLALNEGGFTVYPNSGTNIISYVKDWGAQYVLVVVNVSSSAQTVNVTGLPVSGGTPKNIIGANSASAFSGSSITIDAIPANGIRVILLQNGSGTAYTDASGNAVSYYAKTGIFTGDLQ